MVNKVKLEGLNIYRSRGKWYADVLFGRFIGFGDAGFVWRWRRLRRRQPGFWLSSFEDAEQVGRIDSVAAVARFPRRKRAFLDGAPDVYSAGCGLLSRFKEAQNRHVAAVRGNLA